MEPELKRSPTPSKNIANKCKKMIKTSYNPQNLQKQNELLRKYYFLQLGLPQNEYELFWNNLKNKSPINIRLNLTIPNIQNFIHKFKNNQFIRKSSEIQTNTKSSSKLLECYNIGHQSIFKIQSQFFQGMLKKDQITNFNKYVQKCCDCGLVSKQHFSSIVAPLFLNIQSNDMLLDICAAPGHKTSLVLQLLSSTKNISNCCVVANDIQYRRVQMLTQKVHQSGTVNLIAINHPGQTLPELYYEEGIKKKLEYNKIICDVPCSGDGSIRDIPIKWTLWNYKDALMWHSLQLSLLIKSINCLSRNNGLLLYCTSSLNPIENQAVITGLFRHVDYGLQIIDIHDVYPIKGRRGLMQWSLFVQKSQFQEKNTMFQKKDIFQGQRKKQQEAYHQSFQQVKSYDIIKDNEIIKETMFPLNIQEMKKIKIYNTMRCLPVDNNSNGFYFALIKKSQNFKWKNSIESTFFSEDSFNIGEQKSQQKLFQSIEKLNFDSSQINDDKYLSEQYSDSQTQKIQQLNIKCHIPKNRVKFKCYKFINLSQNDFLSIQKFYGLPNEIKKLLFVKEGSTKKKVFLVSEGVHKLLMADNKKQLRIVRMGCKVLQKSKQLFAANQCCYRLCQDGILYMMNIIEKRKIKVNLKFFRWVLQIHSVLHQDIQDENLKKQFKKLGQGSFMIYIDENNIMDGMVGQNFKTSFHLMISKQNFIFYNKLRQNIRQMNRKIITPKVVQIFQTITLKLNLTDQTLYNAIHLLMDLNLSQQLLYGDNLAIAAIYLSHKLHQRKIYSIKQFLFESNNKQNVVNVQQILCINLRWKISKNLMIDQILQITAKWNQFIKHTTLLGILFDNQKCPTNFYILKQNTYKVTLKEKTHQFNIRKIAIAIFCITIENAMMQVNKNQKFCKNKYVKFIINDFLNDQQQYTLKDLIDELKYVESILKKHVTSLRGNENVMAYNKLKQQKLCKSTTINSKTLYTK